MEIVLSILGFIMCVLFSILVVTYIMPYQSTKNRYNVLKSCFIAFCGVGIWFVLIYLLYNMEIV